MDIHFQILENGNFRSRARLALDRGLLTSITYCINSDRLRSFRDPPSPELGLFQEDYFTFHWAR